VENPKAIASLEYSEHVALSLVDLDEHTRQHMLAEFEDDLAASRLYLSPRLDSDGRLRYPELLREAFGSGSDMTLAAALSSPGILKTTEQRKTKSGVTMAKVPHTAPQTLAEGEFNRFYLRGLARRAIAEGVSSVVIYRARASENPRPESLALENTELPAEGLLADLRESVGVDTALGLPPGPNSGLSARLP
jgi:hypothetical protein